MDQRIQNNIQVYTVCPHMECPLLESTCTTQISLLCVDYRERDRHSVHTCTYGILCILRKAYLML